MGTRLRATERLLPYRIGGHHTCSVTCHTSERAPPWPQLGRKYLIYLPCRDGKVSWFYTETLSADSHPST